MKISFDFDGTLDDEFDGSVNTQKEEIKSIAKDLISKGHQVCIITKRYDQKFYMYGKGNEHKVVYDLAKTLGIREVYFTNREMKFSTILKLGIDMHFENSLYEVELINQACKQKGHNCNVIHVESSNWREKL